MKPLLDSCRINSDVLPVVAWIAKANHPPYQEALEIIRDWWVGIAGKQVNWEVLVGIGGSNSLTYQCRIDKTCLRNGILHYCTSTTERCHFVPVKELYLDLELQMLTAVTDSSLNMTYRIRLLEAAPTPGMVDRVGACGAGWIGCACASVHIMKSPGRLAPGFSFDFV